MILDKDKEMEKITRYAIICLSYILFLSVNTISGQESGTNSTEGFSCSESTIKLNTSSNVTNFYSQEYGFEIDFPSNWDGNISTCTSGADRTGYLLSSTTISLNSTNSSIYRTFVEISVTDNYLGTIEDYINFSKSFDLGTSSIRGPFLFYGIPAYTEVYDLEFVRLETINFVYNGNLFNIAYPVLGNSNNDNVINNIINSFRFEANLKNNSDTNNV